MLFKICEYCGAHLDPGESCDCRKEEAAERCCCKTVAGPPINNLHNAKKEETENVIREKY